ncbi:MAG: enoyl-CoA hydratase/isomerase family protein [Terriglobales bacterium]|jgi:enoyl-CoA hydratase/carnithine racemase
MNHPKYEIDWTVAHDAGVLFLTLVSPDGLNRLTLAKVRLLTEQILNFHASDLPALSLVLSGEKHFSAGADLNEIRILSGAGALEFAKAGQALMKAIDEYPAPVIAAVAGYCLGGGLDLALACDVRIAHPHAVFGHRGAALGLMTGWGGTQRLSRLVGPVRAMEMFVSAQKLTAARALEIGLVQAISDTPDAMARKIAEEWQFGGGNCFQTPSVVP